ncbi:MAG: NUDIX hydrolase [Clostridia bacterium]|nr:NUDIX hydrolase [Clostridia bacterium]
MNTLYLKLQDTQWPYTYTDHDRQIARAIVVDQDGYYYFVRACRDDDFGKATIIETAGGGAEPNEELETAIKRELLEELGVNVNILGKIGVVEDYYNLIHRHNINNYFLCEITSFGRNNLTEDEKNVFHLSTLKLTYQEAHNEYVSRMDTKLGTLVGNRELPVLEMAQEILKNHSIF